MMLWIICFASLAGCVAAVVLSRYLLRQRASVDRIVQGDLCISAGLITLLSLLLPWLKTDGNIISGIDTNSVFVPSLRPFVMLLPIVSFLTVFGGFLHIVGYNPGKRLMIISPLIGLLLSLVLTFFLSYNPVYQNMTTYDIDWGPLVYVYGSISGVIAGRLGARAL